MQGCCEGQEAPVRQHSVDLFHQLSYWESAQLNLEFTLPTLWRVGAFVLQGNAQLPSRV